MAESGSLDSSIIERLTPQHRALLPKLSPDERRSMEENVTLENIETIQSWIGTDEEIQAMLFWDRGGNFDDPTWQTLRPLDETSAGLYEAARTRLSALKQEAVEVQRRSDLTLHSQFNAGLLFTGLAGAVRCSASGEEAEEGEFFRGVELRCIGSVEEETNRVTIHPVSQERFEVHFGGRITGQAEGIQVYTGDSFSLIQLSRLVEKDLPGIGYKALLRDSSGQEVTIDPKAVRKAARKEEGLRYETELTLYAFALFQAAGEAIQGAENLSRCFYERFGLETECAKIGKKYRNFKIMRDDNFHQLLPQSPARTRGLVMLTATLVCRRCRREVEGFRNLTRRYPDVTFALVNLTSPQSKFYERVFGDMAGGDPNRFRNTAKGATPFTIVYAPDENGVLEFAEYYGTEKAEAAPTLEECVALLRKYFGSGLSKINSGQS